MLSMVRQTRPPILHRLKHPRIRNESTVMNDDDFQPSSKKQRSTSDSQPDLSLIFQKCHVLYDGDKWYDGTITGAEFVKEHMQWMYKISFSDGETTLASRDDPEVRFPF